MGMNFSIMQIINNFSGGLCSFWAAYRNVKKYGAENNILLFADTLVESLELYEFNARASDLLGVPITRVSIELTPWQLFRREKMIGNNRFPICSVMLKREVLNEWQTANYNMDSTQPDALKQSAALSLGFDWTEDHRTEDMRAKHPTWDIRAPMQHEPIWDKCKMQREAEKLNLPISSAYTNGMPHDNCGGRCVRAGISHWAHLLKIRPEAFAEWEREEKQLAEELIAQGITPLSMLKDRRGGQTRNLYLHELRARIEAGEMLDKHDWGGCGCA